MLFSRKTLLALRKKLFSRRTFRSATGNSIVGNWIGTSADGLGQAGNQMGVALTAGASGNFIGGTTATPGTGAGNVISGNTVNGVHLEVTNSNQVSGNVIGLDRFGSLPVGNVIAGVYLVGVTTGNVIGGTGAGEGNQIADQINIADSTGGTVQGNTFGLNAAWTAVLAGSTAEANRIRLVERRRRLATLSAMPAVTA